MSYLMVLGGLAALLLGGGALVSGAVAIARRWGLSPLVIGVTLVGIGTSLPELLTSLRAAFAGAPGLAFGNVIGSNTANVLLILGLSALVAPIAFARRTWRREGLTVLAVSVVTALWIALSGGLGRFGAAAFLLTLAGLMTWQLRSGGDDAEDEAADDMSMPRAWLAVAVGFAGVLIGAELLVRGAIDIARALGVSEAVIGLTVVAVGTSLPELATSAVAAWKGRSDVALGNVLGSNLFNLLGILGLTGLVIPIPAEARFATLDLPVMVGTVALLLTIGWRGTIGRVAGGGMVAAYAGYVWMLQM
ncbi:calcium/sodium antiporter [Jannaschia rubra]|uniref:Inner membrane protein YrbG n=1 Tax=Jannaschia rubra TaxID=282197 RepID=A0A0M6XRS7_9RHOB|nr:calcium/sodium antiporter [Jannaschia rubra]CTQ33780.1 Inner membrane protein YrbG [Jannaschia rubra]SFG08850.1 cation:H+ antiporter [Jannaschia rubra]